MRHRKIIRLKGYDYSLPGYYFVTINTKNREQFFGNIIEGKMKMIPAGIMIKKWWLELKNKFNAIDLDEFIIMPDHIHGIIIINHPYNPRNPVNPRRGGPMCPPPQPKTNITPSNSPSISRIIQWFKTMTTNEYIRGVKNDKYPVFDKKLWHRSFYEHIIRDKRALMNFRRYIQNNPENWDDRI